MVCVLDSKIDIWLNRFREQQQQQAQLTPQQQQLQQLQQQNRQAVCRACSLLDQEADIFLRRFHCDLRKCPQQNSSYRTCKSVLLCDNRSAAISITITNSLRQGTVSGQNYRDVKSHALASLTDSQRDKISRAAVGGSTGSHSVSSAVAVNSGRNVLLGNPSVRNIASNAAHALATHNKQNMNQAPSNSTSGDSKAALSPALLSRLNATNLGSWLYSTNPNAPVPNPSLADASKPTTTKNSLGGTTEDASEASNGSGDQSQVRLESEREQPERMLEAASTAGATAQAKLKRRDDHVCVLVVGLPSLIETYRGLGVRRFIDFWKRFQAALVCVIPIWCMAVDPCPRGIPQTICKCS